MEVPEVPRIMYCVWRAKIPTGKGLVSLLSVNVTLTVFGLVPQQQFHPSLHLSLLLLSGLFLSPFDFISMPCSVSIHRFDTGVRD